jgi:peptidoglycan/LPS O-acetylase OafA/YrhL
MPLGTASKSSASTLEPAEAIPAAAGTQRKERRLLQLDVLRAIAILLVLGRHIHFPAGGVIPRVWERCGWIGVDLFFVLSGFLVGGLLFKEQLREGDLRIGRFLIRRGFKIYPPFYAMLTFTLLMFATGAKVWIGWQRVIGEALFLQNYLGSLWAHTWSLAVEEHFYLLLALLVAVLLRRHPNSADPFRHIPWIVLASAIACLALRTVTAIRQPFHFTTHIAPTHLRIDSLFFGVFLSYAWNYHHARLIGLDARFRWIALPIAGAVIASTLLVELDSRFMHTIGLTLLFLAFGAVLMIALTSQRWVHNPPARALAWIGFYSYSIYLWHVPFYAMMARVLAGRGYWTHVAVLVPGSIVLGMLAALVVEIPSLKIRDRLFPPRARAITKKEAVTSEV